jgi:hypothetical protein
MFKVTTLPIDDVSSMPLIDDASMPLIEDATPSTTSGNRGKTDFSKDFFGKPTYLTVSGQLSIYLSI